jgi:hypothetical protein
MVNIPFTSQVLTYILRIERKGLILDKILSCLSRTLSLVSHMTHLSSRSEWNNHVIRQHIQLKADNYLHDLFSKEKRKI